MFSIGRFSPQDESQLMKAWMEAYPDLFHFKFPERWRWNMFGNPFVPEERRPLCWVASRNGEIAAWSSAMAVPIHASGIRVIGGHSCDTFTLERYRRYGFGKKLQELNQDAHDIFIAIDPSPANRRNKYKVGGHPGKPLETWLRVGRSLDRDVLYRSFLRLAAKYLGSCGVRLLSSCGNLGLSQGINCLCSKALRSRQRDMHTLSPAASGLRFEAVERFGTAADELWKEVVKRYSFTVSRDSAYLNWKYILQPNLSYRRFLAWRDGAPAGLVIWRLPLPAEQKVGIVSECFCIDDDPSTHASLVAYALEDFERHGIDTIKCGASTRNQRQALQNLGFGQVDIDVPVFHISPRAAGIALEALMEKDWLLSLGDSDIDQVRPEHQPSFVEIVRIMRGRIPGSEHLSG